MTKQSEAIDLAEIAAGLPRRIHEVVDRHVVESPDRIALIEDGSASTYHELNQSVAEVAAALGALGVRPGDRMMIVSENCIALSALLLAASRLDAWAIVGSPSQQIRSGGARQSDRRGANHDRQRCACDLSASACRRTKPARRSRRLGSAVNRIFRKSPGRRRSFGRRVGPRAGPG